MRYYGDLLLSFARTLRGTMLDGMMLERKALVKFKNFVTFKKTEYKVRERDRKK